MFDKLLIANRGEIACRVIRTARDLGVATVAVHSDADAGALHVEMADEAVLIGGPQPADSYLRGDRIIEAAQSTGAQAIHPGYGFLSENPDFVAAVEAAGLTFVGPPAEAIRAMGLKDAAKRLMAEAGVPVVPGYHGADQDPGRLEVEADRVGYPVLIKAVAGGGGKGMRKVDDPARFVEALESAKSEALGAFGNDAVLIEKYMAMPRHIEVQVFGDGTRAVHLFERDCSLQRRHQKVIEEAPAPGMTDEMRNAMGDAAVRAAEAIGYSGAGTVEFIVDASEGLRPDRFYFMEMNTRLQVEHPVTEAVTGVDLVAWQLRVAAGEPLPADQADLSLSGHAVEARLYAEDVPAGFLPATGRIDLLEFPDGVRADTGVRSGDTITPWYDPMIAKIVVAAPTRAAAVSRLGRALATTRVSGAVTNLPFLRRLAGHTEFRAGRVHTGLIAADLEALSRAPEPCTRTRALAGVAALSDGDVGPLAGFTLWEPLTQHVTLKRGADTETVQVTWLTERRRRVRVGEAAHLVERQGGAWWIDGAKTVAEVRRGADRVSVFWGNGYEFDLPDPLRSDDDDGGSGNLIEAPMPGQVKSVHAQPGQAVATGDRLVVLEAMKMEHTLTARRDGVLAEVLVAAGDQVEAGAPLVRLEEEAS